jgi:hypothetical protein
MTNYSLQYKQIFDFGKRVNKQFLKTNPKNFYRISRYEYADGDTKSLSGIEASIVFVIGTHENKVNCIKLNEVKPDIFLRWFPTLLNPSIKIENISDRKLDSDVIISGDIYGNQLFESKIKNKPIYNVNPRPYRTYNLDGLQYIQKINLKKEILKTMI